MGRRIEMPNGFGGMNPNQAINILPPQGMPAITTLYHDVQLIGLIAAQCPGTADEAVERAIDILFHAIVRSPELQKRIQAHVANPGS